MEINTVLDILEVRNQGTIYSDSLYQVPGPAAVGR